MNNKNTIYKIIYCCSKHRILALNYCREAYITSTAIKKYLYTFSKPKSNYDYIEFNITNKEIRRCFVFNEHSINYSNNYSRISLNKVDEFGIPYWFNFLKETVTLLLKVKELLK